MKSIYTILAPALFFAACSSNNNVKDAISLTDSLMKSASGKHAISRFDSLKSLIIGTWTGVKEHGDTIEITSKYVVHPGEDTKLKYVLQNDSITIYADSTIGLKEADNFYKAKVSATKNTLTFTDSDSTDVLSRVR